MPLSIELAGPALRAAGFAREVKGDRVVSFRSSTPDLDRHGTRILPQGIRTENYERNPIFVWGHDAYGSLAGGPAIESVIGRTIRHNRSAEGFDHDVEFAPASVNPKAEMALRMVRSGFLNSTSIGFSPVDGKWHEEKSASAGAPPVIVFDEVDLLEVSLVPIPSNPNAQALARALAGNGFDSFLRGLQDDELAGRVEAWVRSAQSEPSRSSETHPTPGEPTRSQDDAPDEPPRSPWADLIRNVELRPFRPSVASQLTRAIAAIPRR